MHKAIIKCESYVNEYIFSDYDFNNLQLYRLMSIKSLLDLTSRNLSYSWNNSYYKWTTFISNIGCIRTNRTNTGLVTLDEIEVNLDILKNGDNLYIEKLNDYKEIIKVEVHPSGTVIYTINHFVQIETKKDNNLYEMVDEWFTNYYPELNSFDELINYKEDTKYGVSEIYEYQKIRDDKMPFYEASFAKEFNQFKYETELPIIEKQEIDSNNSTIENNSNNSSDYQKSQAGAVALLMSVGVFILLMMLLIIVGGNL